MMPLARSTCHKLNASRPLKLLYVTVFPQTLQMLFWKFSCRGTMVIILCLKISDTILLLVSEEGGQGGRAHGHFNMHSLKCEGMAGKKGCRLVCRLLRFQEFSWFKCCFSSPFCFLCLQPQSISPCRKSPPSCKAAFYIS